MLSKSSKRRVPVTHFKLQLSPTLAGTVSVTGSDHQMIYRVCREKLLLTPTVSYVRSFKRCDMAALLADKKL